MTLDAATFVGNMDQTLPALTDLISEGDDHIRTIKTCVKNSFPNVAGAVGAGHADLAALSGSADIVATPTPLWALWYPAQWTILSGSGRIGTDGRFHGHLRAQALVLNAQLSSMMKCPSPASAFLTAIYTSWFQRAGVYKQMASQIFGADFNSVDLAGAAGTVQIGDVFYLNWNYHTR